LTLLRTSARIEDFPTPDGPDTTKRTPGINVPRVS
jgi:hypothetical protein